MLRYSADFLRRYTQPGSWTQRLPNPTGTQWAIITAAGAAALVIATTAWADSGTPGPVKQLPDVEPDLECDADPYDVDTDEIRAAIGTAIGTGQRDQAIIATNIATALFGAHPDGGVATFPPSAAPLPGVVCVWSVVVFLVDDEFKKRGLGDIDVPETPEGSLVWVTRGSKDLGYPWEEPVLHTTNWPSPGMFTNFNVEGSWDPSQGYDSYIRALLGSALAMAGMDVGIATSNAGQELRKQLREAVMAVGGFNDLNYGQTNLNYAGGNDPDKPGGNPNNGMSGQYVLNEAGRGLNWLPRHHDVVSRVGNAQPTERGTRIDGAKLGGGNGGNRQMTVWGPAVSLAKLQQGFIGFDTWSDGSSTLDPPPQITKLGVNLHGVVLSGV